MPGRAGQELSSPPDDCSPPVSRESAFWTFKVGYSPLLVNETVVQGGVAKWLRRRSAKPLLTGSTPVAASIVELVGRTSGNGLPCLAPQTPGASAK
jgi:hypothetical protein